MSGINPESKNTIQRRRVLAVIRQITLAPPRSSRRVLANSKIQANKNFAGLQVLPD